MTVTTALARWSKQSNRRRAVETGVRALPWLVAGGALAAFVTFRAGTVGGAATAGLALVAVIVLAVRRQRGVRHAPPTLARALDQQHRTVDLLQTALALEAKPGDESIDAIVLARAAELVPKLGPVAVPPLRLRASPFAGLSVLAAGALLFLTGAGARGAHPEPSQIAERTRAKASELAKAMDELAKDPDLSPDARAKLEAAKQALERAASAKTGTAALAAMSDAQRMLDEVAPHLSSPQPEALDKLDRAQLAQKLAQAAKSGDAAALSALAREALRRASASEGEAEQLAQAMAAAAQHAGSDPWAQNGFGNTPADQRLAALASAADQIKNGDVDGARSSLSQLARSASAGRSGKLEAARRALASLRAEERGMLNGHPMPSSDARAEAMRAAARGMPTHGRPGAGMGSGAGSGSGSGSGSPAGMAMRGGRGGAPRPGSPTSGAGINVLAMPGGTPGSQGSTGAHGGTQPSGAAEPAPETVMAEEVDTPPPPAMSPEGVIRAIQEHAAGDPHPEQFGPVRDHYAAIAESAMHRDEIPLTRRDFIQRYFEALRNREEP